MKEKEFVKLFEQEMNNKDNGMDAKDKFVYLCQQYNRIFNSKKIINN